MSSYQKNMLSGLIFLLLGVALLIIIPISVDEGAMSSVGPRAFPQFIAVSMVLLSCLLMASSWHGQRKRADGARPQAVQVQQPAAEGEQPVLAAKKESVRDEGRAFILIAIILLYILTFDKLGYLLSTFLASTLTLVLFRVKKTGYYLVVYASAAAIYFAFTKLLFVMLL